MRDSSHLRESGTLVFMGHRQSGAQVCMDDRRIHCPKGSLSVLTCDAASDPKAEHSLLEHIQYAPPLSQ